MQVKKNAVLFFQRVLDLFYKPLLLWHITVLMRTGPLLPELGPEFG